MKDIGESLVSVSLVLATLIVSGIGQQVSVGVTTTQSPEGHSRVYNIRDFGAVGDGVTNDAAAIQAALDSAQLSGGVVYVPPGRYSVELDCAVDPNPRLSIGDNITVRGAGQEESVISPKEAPCQWTVFGVQPKAEVHIKDLSVEGPWPSGHPIDDVIPPGEGSPRQLTAIIHLGASGLLSLKRVRIHQLHMGIKNDGGTVDVELLDSTIDHLSLHGVLVAGVGSVKAFRTSFHDIGDPVGGPNIYPNAHGLYLKAPISTIRIKQCEFERITQFGIHRYAGTPNGTIDVITTHNRFEDASGIYLDNAPTRAVIAHNVFITPFRSQKVGIITQASGVVINNNDFHTSNVGVMVQSSSDASVRDVMLSGNRFVIDRDGTAIGVELVGNPEYPVIGTRIEKGRFEGSGAPGVGVLTMYAVDTVIENVKFDLAGGPGIWIKDGSDRLIIEDDRFRGDDGRYGGIYITESAADPIDSQVIRNHFDCVTFAIFSRVSGVRFDESNKVKSGEVRLG